MRTAFFSDNKELCQLVDANASKCEWRHDLICLIQKQLEKNKTTKFCILQVHLPEGMQKVIHGEVRMIETGSSATQADKIIPILKDHFNALSCSPDHDIMFFFGEILDTENIRNAIERQGTILRELTVVQQLNKKMAILNN